MLLPKCFPTRDYSWSGPPFLGSEARFNTVPETKWKLEVEND